VRKVARERSSGRGQERKKERRVHTCYVYCLDLRDDSFTINVSTVALCFMEETTHLTSREEGKG
jgi:hypothetical protein